MVAFQEVIRILSDLVWGVPMLVIMLGTGIYLSFKTGFIQFRRFRYSLSNTVGRLFHRHRAGKGEMTPGQALATALGGTVGTGNIVGITYAVSMGGAGALFWLWVSALIGMCTKFTEIVLAMKFRERSESGELVGGPMYYIKNGMGPAWKWLGGLFAFFGGLAAFGGGNAVQMMSITGAAKVLAETVCTNSGPGNTAISLITGILMAVAIGAVLLGGLSGIGKAAGTVVPAMSVLYIVLCLSVIVLRLDRLGGVMADIFRGAFTPGAVTGGAAGITMRTAVTMGLKRGTFSNEAGLGSSPIAHASSGEKNPVRQGLFGIFEVFADTIILCTLTGLTLLVSGVPIEYGTEGSIGLNTEAFALLFGAKVSSAILVVMITLFAFTSMISWALYGMRCTEYLLGPKSLRPYQVLFVAAVVGSSVLKASFIWNIADTLNGLMAIPNLIAVTSLSGVAAGLTKRYFEGYRGRRKSNASASRQKMKKVGGGVTP